jgi:signal transduction histidine kinase
MRIPFAERFTVRWRRLNAPRRTVRLRLTLLYGGLFLASGAALLAITYVLVRGNDDVLLGTRKDGSTVAVSKNQGEADGSRKQGAAPPVIQRSGGRTPSKLTPLQLKVQSVRDRALAERQHAAELRRLLEMSGIALAIMTAISIGLGWLVAGRVLRPLRTITNAAQEISANNLHRRLALEGPDDELKQLATTFDELLGRLEASFAAQRQFAANASHELRTPLTFQRALLEVALADPNAGVGTLRRTCEQLLANGEQQERLIEALLTLSRSQRGLEQRQPFDLAAVADAVLAVRRPEADLRGISTRAMLEPAQTAGDPRLAERLVANLVENGLRYNTTAGHVEVTTTTSADRAVLAVVNSGPLVPAAEVERLFEPFQRLGGDRTDRSDGIGLGLSIVKAIADAHRASLTARTRPDGGLHVEVSFSPASASEARAPDRPREPTSPRRALLSRRRKALGPDNLPTGAGPIG